MDVLCVARAVSSSNFPRLSRNVLVCLAHIDNSPTSSPGKPFEARREQNGLPGVAIRDLQKAALRHRPDRIVLREIGAEIAA
jgi:hypothetical protein